MEKIIIFGLCIVALLSYGLAANCKCKLLSDKCPSNWQMIYEHDSQGSVVSGTRADLIQAILKGARVRVLVNGKYATEVDNLSVRNGHVYAQHLKHVSKSAWDSFQNNDCWWWAMLSTTGHCQMVRYNVGEHKSRGENANKIRIQWFVKGRNSSPMYSHDENGAWVSGSVISLSNKIREGQEVRCVQNDIAYAFPVQGLTVLCNEEYVVAESTLNHVSQMGSTLPKFQPNAYWLFALVTTQGARDMSRWTVGKHESRGHTNDTVALNWFTDPCWKLVYINDENGNAIQGARSSLVSAVLKGHRVRVSRTHATGAYTAEVDNLYVRSGHITGQVLPNVSKKTSKTFQDDAYWYWQMFSTTGTIRHHRYNVGAKTARGNTEEKAAIRWYVDTCPWKFVLKHDKTGNVISGSRSELLSAVKNGASVRLLADNSYLSAAQNLQISPDGEQVGAQILNHISQSYHDSYEVKIQSNPYWWFTIVSTQGRRDMSRWTVGEHEDRGRTQDQVALKWFVNY